MRAYDFTQSLSQFMVLTGRSALAVMNFGASSDPRVIMRVWDQPCDLYAQPIWSLPKGPHFEMMDKELAGRMGFPAGIASENQSLFHLFLYDYDDSALDEVVDFMTDDQAHSFVHWLLQYPDERFEVVEDKIRQYGLCDLI